MPRILLTICLFVSVGLSAQQVFFDLTEDAELPIPLPLDTVWCKAEAIDKVIVKRYYDRDKKHRKGKAFKQDIVFLLKDGIPNSGYVDWSDSDTVYPAAIHRITVKDLNYIDLRDAVYNPTEKSYKRVWVDTVNDRFFKYTKVWYDDSNIKQIVNVNGAIHPKKGFIYYITRTDYNYNNTGLLTSITDWVEDETEEPILNHSFNYKNNIIYRVYINLDPGYIESSGYIGTVSYYSKGKKVKLK